MKRALVSSAVPKPANIRIVQSFERYIEAYGPAGVRELPGELAVVGPVHRLDRDARHRLEVGVAVRRGVEGCRHSSRAVMATSIAA